MMTVIMLANKQISVIILLVFLAVEYSRAFTIAVGGRFSISSERTFKPICFWNPAHHISLTASCVLKNHSSECDGYYSNLHIALTRRAAMMIVPIVVGVKASTPAVADVSDGTTLPQGAQQFARTIKLKIDLKVSNRNGYIILPRFFF
jgi:hypothetical protein